MLEGPLVGNRIVGDIVNRSWMGLATREGGHIQMERIGFVVTVDGMLGVNVALPRFLVDKNWPEGIPKNYPGMGNVFVLVIENVLSDTFGLLKISARHFFNLNMFMCLGRDNCFKKCLSWHLVWKDIVYAGACDVDIMTIGPKLGDEVHKVDVMTYAEKLW